MAKFGWAYIDCSDVTPGSGSEGPAYSLQFVTESGGGTTGSALLSYYTASQYSYDPSTMVLSGNLIVTGAVSASVYHIQNIAIIDATGSSKMGDSNDDHHFRTGSFVITKAGVAPTAYTLSASVVDSRVHVAGLQLADDKTLIFGTNNDWTIEYDEDGDDDLVMTGDKLSIESSTASRPRVTIKNTTNDANSATLRFVKDKGAAGAANDDVGVIEFYGDDANQDQVLFGRIRTRVAVHTNGQEGGKMHLSVASHDGELNHGVVITDGDAEDEVDVTIGNGAASIVTLPGQLTASAGISGFTGTFQGGLSVAGSTVIDEDMNYSGSGTMQVVGNTFIGGTLNVTGNATLAGTTNTQAVTFTNASGSGTMQVVGNTFIGGTLNVTGNADFDGTITCDTSLTIDSTTINAAEIGVLDSVTAGTAAASKAMVLDSSKDISGYRNISGSGTFQTVSNAFLGGTLNVSGNATLAGTTNAQAVTFTNASGSGTLQTVGATTFGNTLAVSGTVSVAEKIEHAGDTDTYISFTTDDINFQAGGVNFLDLTEDTQNEVTFNEGGVDVDFRIETADETHMLFIQGSSNRMSIGDNTGTPGATLEIKNHASAGATGVPLLQLNNNDTDQQCVDINAGNIDANVVNITANDVTTARVLAIGADGLTTGNAFYVDDNSADTGTRNTALIIQNNAAAIAATAFTVQSDGGITGIKLDKNFSDTAAATVTGLKIDVDKTATTTTDNTIYGIDIDVDNTAGTNGTNTMIGIRATPRLTHAADAGTPTVKGAVITATGGTNGAATATGLELTSTGADTNNGLIINCADGGTDLKILSSADTGDYFSIATTAVGATTITTVDDGGAAADLTFTIDGDIILGPGGGDVVPDSDNARNLGSPAKRWANIFTGDLHLRNERGDWTIVEEEDYLCVINNKTGKKFKMNLIPLEDDE